MTNPLSPDEESKLTEIFRNLLNHPDLVLRDDLTAADVTGWDSFTHINLVMQVEMDFGTRFTTHEIAALRNVGEFKALIAEKLKN